MKKQLVIGAIVLATGLSSFGQGYFVFGTSKNFVYDNSTGTGIVAPGTVDVGFIYADLSASPTAFLGAGTPTTGAASGSWANLFNGTANAMPTGWFWATNSPAGTLPVVQADTSAGVTKGNINYLGQAAFQVSQGTGGDNYDIYIIGWSSAYATPLLASQGGSAVGWTSMFSYASGVTASATTAGPPPSLMTGSGAVAFGIAPVPEPSTMLLAGLGGLSLLLFRRRQ
jgi:hypothetical protein